MKIEISQIVKWVCLSFFFVGIVIFLFLIYVGACFGLFNFSGNKYGLINNYNKHKEDLLVLTAYYSKIVPANFDVEIEFKNAHTINLKVYESKGKEKICWFQQWDIDPYNYVPNTKNTLFNDVNSVSFVQVKKKLHWTDRTFSKIQELLNQADCISISNGEPAMVGFTRSGLGLFSYALFDKPIPDSLKDQYNNGCDYLYFNPNVALVYGGGAFGPQCFAKDDLK